MKHCFLELRAGWAVVAAGLESQQKGLRSWNISEFEAGLVYKVIFRILSTKQ